MLNARPNCACVILIILLTAVSASAQTSGKGETGSAPGVNPADNITKFEVISKIFIFDDNAGVSLTTLTLKYDQAIGGRYGLNFELPVARFESPAGGDNGIADPIVRGRVQGRIGRLAVIGGAEVTLPWATEDSLGSDTYQVNPTVAGVYPLSQSVFLAGIVKQILSVAGDGDDVRQGQYRALLAYTAPKGWWVLSDSQYWVDYEAGRRNEFLVEGEVGKMVGPLTGVWLRGGGRLGGNWQRQDWTITLGIRFISL